MEVSVTGAEEETRTRTKERRVNITKAKTADSVAAIEAVAVDVVAVVVAAAAVAAIKVAKTKATVLKVINRIETLKRTKMQDLRQTNLHMAAVKAEVENVVAEVEGLRQQATPQDKNNNKLSHKT